MTSVSTGKIVVEVVVEVLCHSWTGSPIGTVAWQSSVGSEVCEVMAGASDPGSCAHGVVIKSHQVQ